MASFQPLGDALRFDGFVQDEEVDPFGDDLTRLRSNDQPGLQA